MLNSVLKTEILPNIKKKTFSNSDFSHPFPNGKSQGIRLIDFGRSINNNAIAGHIPFRGMCYTSGFACPQMKAGHDWRFQVDLYALAMSLHIVMFGEYAKVRFLLERNSYFLENIF